MPTFTGALEVGGNFDIGNWTFSRERNSSETTLAGDVLAWGADAFARQELGPVSFQLELELDPLLRNYASLTAAHEGDYFSVCAGPVVGFTLTGGPSIRPAFYSSIGMFVPGSVYAELTSLGTFGYRELSGQQFLQESGQIRLGVYAPNAIPGLFVTRDRFTAGVGTERIVDMRSRYGVETALFEKNVPYNVSLLACYQDVRRSYGDPATATHGNGSIVTGVNAQITFFRRLTIRLEFEGSIFSFGTADLFGVSQADTAMVRGRIGASYRL